MAYRTAPSYCKLQENKGCSQWVYRHLKDCVCNNRDIVSFALGFFSLVFWIVSVIPQMITNYKTGSCDGVSVLFLFTWLTGDIFNLVGCLLEPATLPFQLYTAVIFVTITLTLMMQALYYNWWRSGNSSNVEAASNNSFSQNNGIPRSASYGAFIALSTNMPRQAEALMSTHTEHRTTAQWLGWLMAAIYISSRIPQIRLNIGRGNVEGLNPFMFICAIFAHSITVVSIVVRTTEWDKIKHNLPWLFDAVGCTVLDSFIILQYIYYPKRAPTGNEGRGGGTVGGSGGH